MLGIWLLIPNEYELRFFRTLLFHPALWFFTEDSFTRLRAISRRCSSIFHVCMSDFISYLRVQKPTKKAYTHGKPEVKYKWGEDFTREKKNTKFVQKKELQFIPLNTLNANIFHVHARDFFYFYFIWRVRCSVFDYAHLSNSHLHTPELLWHPQGTPSKRQQHRRKTYRYGT